MKWRITAWGHPILPDLDYESDDAHDLRWVEYPYANVAYLAPISREAMNAFLVEGAEKAE